MQRKLSFTFLLLAAFTVLAKAQPSKSDQPKGIHYFFEDTASNVSSLADDGANTFPHAKSCSCNLTDYCSVSCGSYQTADCQPYWAETGGYYCSCQCVDSIYPFK